MDSQNIGSGIASHRGGTESFCILIQIGITVPSLDLWIKSSIVCIIVCVFHGCPRYTNSTSATFMRRDILDLWRSARISVHPDSVMLS